MFSEQIGVGRAEDTPGLSGPPDPTPPARRKRSLIFLVDGLSASGGRGGNERGAPEGRAHPSPVCQRLSRHPSPLPWRGGATCPPLSAIHRPPAGASSPSPGLCFSANPGCLYPALTQPPAPLPAFLQARSALWCLLRVAARKGVLDRARGSTHLLDWTQRLP